MADESGLMNTATLVCVKMRRHLNFRNVLWYSVSTKKICKIWIYPHCSSQQLHPRQLLFTLTTPCKLQLSSSVSVHSSGRHQHICVNTLMWCRIPVAHSQPSHTHLKTCFWGKQSTKLDAMIKMELCQSQNLRVFWEFWVVVDWYGYLNGWWQRCYLENRSTDNNANIVLLGFCCIWYNTAVY